MVVKSLAFGAFGALNVVSFSLFESGGMNNQLAALVIFLLGVGAQAVIFWATTRQKFASLEEWKRDCRQEWDEIKKKAEAAQTEAARIKEQDRRLEQLEEFQRDFYQSRVPGLSTRFRHREG